MHDIDDARTCEFEAGSYVLPVNIIGNDNLPGKALLQI